MRRADEEQAAAAIAGFTVMNDVTMRDWQYRTKQWLQGKSFEHATPLGPVLVTPDELPGGVAPALDADRVVDDEVVQKADTDDLVFAPVALVRYISSILTLLPRRRDRHRHPGRRRARPEATALPHRRLACWSPRSAASVGSTTSPARKSGRP